MIPGMNPLAGIGAARASVNSSYFQPGNHVVQIDSVKVDKSPKGNVNFIIETTVKATTRPKANPVESTASQLMNLAKPNTPGNIKAFILALLPFLTDDDVGTRQNQGALYDYGTAVAMWVASQSDADMNQLYGSLPPKIQALLNERKAAPSQPLRGMYAAVWAHNTKTQGNTDFTLHDWSAFDINGGLPVFDPSPEDSAPEAPSAQPQAAPNQGAPMPGQGWNPSAQPQAAPNQGAPMPGQGWNPSAPNQGAPMPGQGWNPSAQPQAVPNQGQGWNPSAQPQAAPNQGAPNGWSPPPTVPASGGWNPPRQ